MTAAASTRTGINASAGFIQLSWDVASYRHYMLSLVDHRDQGGLGVVVQSARTSNTASWVSTKSENSTEWRSSPRVELDMTSVIGVTSIIGSYIEPRTVAGSEPRIW